MNKLVSKNPIQRFKEGKQIQRYYAGGISYSRNSNGTWQQYRNGQYNTITPEKIVKQKNGTYVAKINGKWYHDNGDMVQFNNAKPTQGTGWWYGNNKLEEEPVLLSDLEKNKTNPKIKFKTGAPKKTRSVLPKGVTDVMATQKMLMDNGWNGGTYGADGKWGKETQAAWDAYKAKQSLVNRINSTPTTDELVSKQPTSVSISPGVRLDLGNIANTSEVKEIPMPQIVNSNNFNQTYNRNNIRANRNIYSNVDQYYDYITNQDSNESKLWNNILGGLNNDDRRKAFDTIMSKYGISGNLGRRDSGRLANLQNDLNLIGIPGSDARKTYLREYWNEYKNPFLNYLSTYKTGGQLVSRNPIQRFKSNFRKEAL